ncbi:bifunctional chorismate-binding protein/class IV aminotransferase [Leptospira ilyithenensis]|uniref:Bifunctional aminodeoxychorismate synthase component I/aminotransferase n=1 Tax=Leptospira ilyithenensis TaxID=2484901 RepID=A0A4R9LRV9_9LEPT|nr:bifunctional anthranilate synthase component I family protein/class IV aminotransferase [Leptospira ilyithenensis]TGN11680.1 bifunctional aminodeoxychorismate synthase component I/aminotransferase [Leptospira ilyithenensis]
MFVTGAIFFEAGYFLEPNLHHLTKDIANDSLLLYIQIFGSKKRITYQTPNLPLLETEGIEELSQPISKETYLSQIKKAQSHLQEGDSYELNISFETNFKLIADPFLFFQKLKRKQKTKYSAYYPIGEEVILSLSPELFWSENNGKIITKPMKGTAKRGISFEEDLNLKNQLQTSEKERAENVMITDLFRNDLGKISKIGTVEVTSLFETEALDSVWQMTSEIKSELLPEISFSEMVTTLFPSGSVSGAPKIRSLEIIKDIEKRERGIYTGSLFRLENIEGKQESLANVSIRTVHLRKDNLEYKGSYSVGSGITILSDPEIEYEECLSKLSFLTKESIPDFEILETIRFFNGRLRFLNLHLNRMEKSASRFGYPFDKAKALESLDSLSHVASGLLRVRLLLNAKGEFKAETYAYTRTDKRRKITLSWGRKKIPSSDPILYHKTTVRGFYLQSLKEAQELGCEDSILLAEDGTVSETCIRNLFFQKGNRWFTPTLRLGGLAGTLREKLISKGWVKEVDCFPKDLINSNYVLAGNSLRGLERVKIRPWE